MPTATPPTARIQTAPTATLRTLRTSDEITTSPALTRCIGDANTFLRDYWGRRPLVKTTQSGSFDDLASLDDLDRMISSLGLRESSLRMVKDGTALTPETYTIEPGTRSRGTERIVNPALVYKRYEEGATIVLEGLQRYWQPLTDFCRELELALGHRLQVNAYVTPPGSQGFAAHRDDHDVFVLQVWGSKHWIVYDRHNGEQVIIDRRLEPGEVLYIPTEFPHAAKTGTSASAHLTVGVITHDATIILREILKRLEREPVFKERLSNPASSDESVLRAEVERVLDDLRLYLDKVDVNAVVAALTRRMGSTSQAIVRGQLRQLEMIARIEDGTLLRRRRGATCRVKRTGDQIRVLLSDRELIMPPVTHEAMNEIAERHELRPRDLHHSMDPQSALVLVRRLVREGLLEVAL